MTREMSKRLGKLERHLGLSAISGPYADAVRALRATHPGMAARLQVSLATAQGDLECALRGFSIEELEVLVELGDGRPEEPVEQVTAPCCEQAGGRREGTRAASQGARKGHPDEGRGRGQARH